MAITPFKVIQGHRFWYQSKAHIRLPVINTNLPPILHRFQVIWLSLPASAMSPLWLNIRYTGAEVAGGQKTFSGNG